jgi:hypothetical protein
MRTTKDGATRTVSRCSSKISRKGLPVTEAIKRVVWRLCSPGAGPKERDKADEAWRKLCERASEERIRTIIFTEDGKAFKADLDQFIGLQERYLFHAGPQGYWPENERRYIELEIEPEDKFLDKHGRSVRGQLLFRESDLEALFAEGSPEKPSPDAIPVPGKKPLPADDGHVEESSSPCRKTISKQNKVEALAAILRERYPTRPAMSVDELMEAVKNEAAQHIGTFKKRTFEDALAITYPQPQSAKFRKVP